MDEIEDALEGLSPEVAGIMRDMMTSRPADWAEVRALRERIVAANRNAATEREFVSLLFAFTALMDGVAADELLDEAGLNQIAPLRVADYRLMLTVEASEGGVIDPGLLDEITEREVEAGRLAADDEFRQLAAAGAAVLGSPPLGPKRGFLARLFGRREGALNRN